MENENTHDVLRELCIAIGGLVAQNIVDGLEVKGALLEPKEACIDRKKDELIKAFDEDRAKKKKAMDRTGVLVSEKLPLLSHLDRERVQKEFLLARQLVREITEGTKILDVNAEKTLQSVLGLSNETLLILYNIGYESFMQGEKEDALAMFDMLTTLNPLVFDYWIAQGLAQRSLSKEKEALYSFAFAIILNPEHPTPRYNSAELYFQQQQMEDAKIELEVLEEIIKAQKLFDLQPEVASLRGRIFSKTA